MRNIAIVYASKNGQTEKIVEHLQRDFEDDGCSVETWNVAKVHARIGSHIEGVVFGGPVYAGRFQRPLVKWMRKNKESLKYKEIGFFVVALNTADHRPTARKADDDLLQSLIEKTGIVPDMVANFAGALNYTKYPSLIRWQMRRIAAEAGGSTDVSKDHEYTDWAAVTAFSDAFRERDAESMFAIGRRFPKDRSFNEQMGFYEFSSKTKAVFNAPPPQVFDAFSGVNAKSLTGAEALAKVRTLGMGKQTQNESFAEAAQSFGVIPLGEKSPSEILGGLVGKFWRLDFGIRHMSPEEFALFEEPGFVKVLTRFAIEPLEGRKSEVTATMRIHCTSKDAAKKFGMYWTLLNPGIRLYMRSVLKGWKKQAETDRSLKSFAPSKI